MKRCLIKDGLRPSLLPLLFAMGSLFIFSSAFATTGDVSQSFTLEGELYDSPTGSTPLLDQATILVKIYDPSKNCVLYAEQQLVDTSATNGVFNIQIGSNTGALKRVGGVDAGNTMREVFQNRAPITATGCAGNLFTPAAPGGEGRVMEISVTPVSSGMTDVLSPDIYLGSVPFAVVSESVQGYGPDDFIKTNTSTSLSQTNVENIFSNTNYPILTALLAGGPTSNAVNTVLNADSDGNGTGSILFNIAGVTKAEVKNDGDFAVDTNTLYVEAGTNRVGIGTSSPTALLDLSAGVAAVGGAPLKLAPGTNLTTPEIGAIEFDGTNLYFTDNTSTRRSLQTTSASTPLSKLSAATAINTFDNTNFAQLWQWNGLTTQTGLTMRSDSVTTGSVLSVEGTYNNAASTGTILNVATSGASSNAVPLMITNAGAGKSFRVNDDGTTTDSTPFVIDNTGSVGVGTASPNRLLEVAGPIRISPTALPGSPAAGDLAFDSGASNALKFYNGSGWQTIGTGTGDGDFLKDGSLAMTGSLKMGGNTIYGNSTASGNLTLESTSDATKGYVLLQPSGGNVGIGTTTPTGGRLHSYSSTNTVAAGVFEVAWNNDTPYTALAVRRSRPNNTQPQAGFGPIIEFQAEGTSDGSVNELAYITAAWESNPTSAPNRDGFLSFATALDGALPTEKVRISASGNLGIGTNSPNRLLEVAGPVRISPAALPSSPAAGDLAFDSGASNALKFYNGSSWQTVGTGTGSGDFLKDGTVAMTGNVRLNGNYLSGDGGNEGILVDGSGNVTVSGTTTMNSSLTVNGALSATSTSGNTLGNSSNTNASATVVQIKRERGDSTAPGANFAGILDFALEGFTDASFVSAANLTYGWEGAQTNNTTDRDSYVAISTMANNTVGERVRIDSAGNVGIGTQTPNRLLEVAGPVRITPAALPSSPAAGDLAFDSGASNALKFYNGTSWQTVGTGSGAGDFFKDGSVAMTGNFQLGANYLSNDGGSEGLSVDTAGRSQVTGGNGTTAQSFGITNTSSAAASQTLLNFNHAATTTAQLNETQVSAGNNSLAFLTMSGASLGERMRIHTNGYVGIGTNSPNRLLEVAGPVRITPTALPGSPAAGDIALDSGASNALKFYNGSSWETVATGTPGITALTGDVSASGTGSVTATIGTDAVTFAKFQNVSTNILLGRASALAGDVEEITLGAALSISSGALKVNIGTAAGTVMGADAVPNCTASEKLQMSAGPVYSWTCVTDATGAGDFKKDGSVAMTGALQGSVGTAALPGYTFSGDLNTGMSAATADTLVLSTAGSARMTIDSSGKVGIGNTPGEALEVTGNIKASGQIYSNRQTSSVASPLTFDTNSGNVMVWTTNTASPTVNIHNMKPGAAYTFVIAGTGTGTVTLNCYSDGGTTSLPTGFQPANGGRVAGTLNKSVYTLLSDGTNCLITWITGF